MPNPLLQIVGKLKPLLGNCFGMLGLDIVRTHRGGSYPPIMGTFPPYTEFFCVGQPENYFIHDGYRHRSEAIYYDDTANADEWQREFTNSARKYSTGSI